jgi:hypothetical protein
VNNTGVNNRQLRIPEAVPKGIESEYFDANKHDHIRMNPCVLYSLQRYVSDIVCAINCEDNVFQCRTRAALLTIEVLHQLRDVVSTVLWNKSVWNISEALLTVLTLLTVVVLEKSKHAFPPFKEL